MDTGMKNNIDAQIDETLEKCVLSTPRKSFSLFAGAGSGKTYSLVLLLKKIRNGIGKKFVTTREERGCDNLYECCYKRNSQSFGL